MSSNTSANNCSQIFILQQYLETMGIVEEATASISVLCCIFVIALMIIYKKYVFTIQRVILYLTVSTILNSITHIFESATLYSEGYCMVIAFFNLYSAYCVLFSIDCFLVDMIYRVKYFRETGAIEWLYIPAIFVTPLLVAWIPFLTGSYGRVNGICVIVTINSTTCEQDIKGLIMYLVFWWIPLYLTFIVGGLAYVYILWKLWRSKKRYTAVLELDRELMYQKIVSDINYLKWYPLIYGILNIIPVINSTVYHIKPATLKLPLYLFSIVVRGLQGGFIAIAATLDPKTRKRMKWRHIKAAFIENVLCRDSIEEYPIITSSYTDSLNPN